MAFPEARIAAQVDAGTVALPRWAKLGRGCPPVLRLGLATRGNTHLVAGDIGCALDRGMNYLNWCGYDDRLARALRERRIDRRQVVIAMQLESRDARAAGRELEQSLRRLGTDSIDVVTFYYMEQETEWEQIAAPGGALRTLEEARRKGRVSIIGLTTHQRPLGAKWAESGKLDLLMIRYNAAHRGAEQDVFPVTDRLGIPVVAYTAQRWGALREHTPDDPADFTPPLAPGWYRFALARPSVSVVLMAPANRQELEEDLRLLEDWHAPRAEEFETLAAHGQRVRQHAGIFW